MIKSLVGASASSLAMSAVLLLAGNAAARMPQAARTAQRPPAELGGVTVTDTAIDEAESETSYKTSRSTGAMRTDTPLVDVPQSVTVVPQKQIFDQAASSIADAIRYVPGVFSAQGEGNRDTLVFRGNSTTGDFFVDGVRDDVQTYRDLYNIERLEVFKGPNAMIFGRGGVGGLINRVTKAADWTPHRFFRLEGGSFEHKRAQFDLGAPLAEVAAVRLTGVYQDSDSYRDGVDYNRWGFNPTVSFRLGEATTVTAGYEHFQDDRIADRGVSAVIGTRAAPGGPLRTRRGEFFGDPEGSPTDTNTDAATLFVEHRFSDDVSIRNRTRYADYDKFYQNVFPGTINTAAATNPAGLPAGVYAPRTIVQISAYNQATRRENLFNQTDVNARFSTGAIEHALLVGAEFGRQETDNLRLEGFFPTATNAAGVQQVFARIAAPRIRRPDVLYRPIASSGDNFSVAEVSAGYVQDQIALSPMFDVVLGLRFEHFRTRVTDRRTVGFPATQQREFRVTDDLWSPRGGLIFKPAENASLYAAYSRTYLPRGGDQLSGLTLTNQALDPERYQNYELGAKWDVVPTFNLAAAVFQLDRENVLVLGDPANPASQTVPSGKQRTKGVELSAQGEITSQLSVIGSYTYSDATFLDNVSGVAATPPTAANPAGTPAIITVAAGNRLPNVPRHAASLWTRFDPVRSFGVAAGVIYQGRRFAGTDNFVAMPGYTRVDAALYHRLSDAVDLQLNVENIFGERYFLYAHSNTNITPGSPTAFRVGLNARF